MKAKYPNGTRVKVKIGHRMWSNDGNGKIMETDTAPYLTEDTATVMYTYGEKSETDWKFSKGDDGYKQYGLKFDKYGEISWFDESDLIVEYPAIEKLLLSDNKAAAIQQKINELAVLLLNDRELPFRAEVIINISTDNEVGYIITNWPKTP